jgi:hypothetical protein
MRALLRYGGNRRAVRAFAERQEMVKAGLTRRDLVRMGLIAGGGVGGGLLATEKGMAAELRSPAALGKLPPLKRFVEPLPILPVLPRRDPTTDPSFAAHPSTAEPNRSINPRPASRPGRAAGLCAMARRGPPRWKRIPVGARSGGRRRHSGARDDKEQQ